VEDESEVSLHDPNYKIKKNLSLNMDLENDNKLLGKNHEKDIVPNSKFVDQELWRSLLPFVNGKKAVVLVDRMKKSLPEKEASYLIEKFLKGE